MWYLVLFFVGAGVLGTVIGYMVETSWSVTAEVLTGVGVLALVSVIVRMVWTFVVQPCLTAIDEVVRFGEESAGR